MAGFYRRLPEEWRRCLRPLNLADEIASFAPPPVAAAATTTTEMVRRLARLPTAHLPILRVSGREPHAGRSLVCLIAADPLSTRFWTRALFAGDVAVEELGTLHALDAGTAIEDTAAGADIVLRQLPWPLARRARGHVLVPSSVPLWLDTSCPFEAIVHGERRGRSSRKDDARRVRRLGLTMRLATDAPSREWFRRELYEPYASRRFGDLYLRVPPHAFRHAHRRGWLLLLEHGGRTVAGALLERWGRDVRILAFGVAIDAPIASGLLLEACYYHAIEFAAAQGFPRLSLGTTRPVLRDGVLRYKRKWGAALGRPSTWEAFALRYRNTAAVRSALTATPLVIDRGRDGLAALTGIDGMPADAVAALDTPGLREIGALVDATPVVLAPPDPRIRIVPPGAVWPVEAALPGSDATVAEAVPVRDLPDRAPAADAELARRAAHRD